MVLPPEAPLNWMQTLADLLDGVDIGMCLFDEDDRARVWNRTFLLLFPEHEGHVHVGEHYADNLRRFYSGRLAPEEMDRIESMVQAGVQRHREQHRPFEFEHRGMRMRASSQPLPGLGRLRLWRPYAPVPRRQDDAPWQPPGLAPSDGAAQVRLLDHVPDGLMICSPDGVVQWANDACGHMYRLRDAEAARGHTLEGLYRAVWSDALDDEPAAFHAGLDALWAHRTYTGAPIELPMPGGRWHRVIGRPAEHGALFLAHVDITEIKRQQARLAEAERQARASEAALAEKSAMLQATLESMAQGVALFASDGRLELINPRAIELLGLPADLVARRPTLQELLDHMRARGEFDGAPDAVRQYLASELQWERRHTYERVRPDGRVLEVHTVPVAGGSLLRTFTDVTERRRREEHMRHVANHDGLTGLVNRRMFLECLSAEVAIARRTGTGCAVLYLDLDDFKPINDRYGHEMGDRALVRVGQLLRHIARESDFVGRLGGDEFAVLQRGVRDRQQADGLARRLVEALRAPFEIDGLTLQLGVSVGVALCPDHALEPEVLLRLADRAMYDAKARGLGVAAAD